MNHRLLAICLIACAGSICGTALADQGANGNPDALLIRKSGFQGAVSGLFAAPGATIPIPADKPANQNGAGRAAALRFFDQYGTQFGIRDAGTELQWMKVETDLLGQAHTTFQQVFKGIEVYTGVLKVHQLATGEVLGANGRFYDIKPTMSVTPTVDAKSAEAAMRRDIPEGTHAALESIKLVIVDPGWYGDPIGGGPRLAYQVILNDIGRNALGFREAAFIDAQSGELLDKWSLLEALLDRQIYDGGAAPALPGTLARAEGASPTGTADIDKAYDYAGDFYNYLQRGFNRDSINNAGFSLVLTVNSTAANCPNAFFNGAQAAFCAGVVTDDVVAHELTHGLTGFTAGLIYQNQSGQLNESFSDVFGECVDLFNGNVSAIGAPSGIPWPNASPSGSDLDLPNNARGVCSPRPTHPDGVRWLVGEGSSAFGGAIRDMFDPTCRNHPDRANSVFETCSASDSGGVHSGSGVPNHAFMLTTDGGTFNGRTISGIGLIKSGAVWYRALTVYLTPGSDFKDAYDAFNQAATDLVGSTPRDPRTGLPSSAPFTGSDAAQVNLALLATEMNTDGLCGQTNNVLDDATIPPECANATVIFSDTFEGTTLNWQVANSAPPTPYNWVLTSTPLPFGRLGKAAFCEDRAVGDCNTVDESATHTMTSVPIVVPSTAQHPMLAFTHSLGSEGSFDGGRVEISIGTGAFLPVPRTAIEFNPYNGTLKPASIGNTDPLAGQDVWTGIGGHWGRTIIDLSSMGVIGTSMRIRFTFGKDGCTGGPGWYVDDLSVYNCPDCNANTIADIREYKYRASTPFVGPVGTGVTPMTTLTAVPDATGTVTIELLANADLSLTTETIDLQLNGTSLATFFTLGGIDCARTPSRESKPIPAASFNTALHLGAGGTTAVLAFIGSADVNPAACDASYIGASIRFDRAAASADTNGNLVPDTCDCPRPNCRADFNCSGGLSVQDIFDVLAAWFAGSPTANFNTVNGITVQDIFDFLSAWFAGCP